MTDQHNDGGPAFPQNDLSVYNMGPAKKNNGGMTLRDWFAGQALAALSGVDPNLPGDSASRKVWPGPEELAMRRAVWSYLQADAMIAAQESTEYTRSDMIPTAAYVAGLEAAAKRALEEAVADDMDTWFEGLRAALSARPDAHDARVVTVAQLESYYNAAAELGEIGICREIRAIIGEPKA